ncbi:shikimate dehydrogenase [Winogradskyella epiphytica]|uniref:Shikimate dehydrogenase n=1 Tax=Winogradskyella epiphytica TaxID=262005 RepID=A0A2V4XEL0_9FLAO|nr:shikimate dehydrogenase [Winogradskyella epiphytica]PYE81024.1 shikimate dehydrogenase [Winogradskyella epiphytica]GGW66291.1 shikimate 5-dehydrogenase [Winogradskyella epiphytica]
MENTQEESKLNFGLVGRNISYSFSRRYFTNKFQNESLPYAYVNFDIQSINDLKEIVNSTPNLKGLNVTIPYKEEVIPLLNKLNKKAKKIGAVNTIKITKNKKLKGYNTDYFGFKNSLKPYLKSHHTRALILGTGGASKAIAYGLQRLGIGFDFVSRSNKKDIKFLYSELTEAIISEYTIIINCTPIGTFPNVDACPDLPYNAITKDHILFDLIYNPEQTKFLKNGHQKGAITINGEEMLRLQAEKAWKIWNNV